MNHNKFNKTFGKTCDDIYKLVGEKENYNKNDAEIMLKGAPEIILRNYKIDINRYNAFENKILSLSVKYAEKLSVTMGFEGSILAMTFGILEGTGIIGINGGQKLLLQATLNGGLKLE